MNKDGRRRGSGYSIGAARAAALIVSAVAPAGGALAQNPEKFEQVVPGKPQPAAPRASFSPAQRELVAKAEAKANYTPGDCAKFTMVDYSYVSNHDATFFPKGAGAVREWRTNYGNPNGESCAVQQILDAFLEGGTRCVRIKSWQCDRGFVAVCGVYVTKHCKTSTGWAKK